MEKESFLCASTIDVTWALENVRKRIQKEMLPFKRKYFKRSRRILNAFDFPYSNGFTEGTNNKIKVIKRKAYGFRNFENFRNRILMTSIKKYQVMNVIHNLVINLGYPHAWQRAAFFKWTSPKYNRSNLFLMQASFWDCFCFILSVRLK